MLDIGVITESSSDWASAPVLVRKKDGTLRYCVDYRALNSKTVKDSFPLPSISQCLDQLCGNTYFSTLDMANGYWQIEIAEQDRYKTASLPNMVFLNIDVWPLDYVMPQQFFNELFSLFLGV